MRPAPRRRGPGDNAIANIDPAAIHDLYVQLQSFPMIPALKAAIAHYAEDLGWGAVRPPVVALTAEQRQRLAESLKARGFSMPGLRSAE